MLYTKYSQALNYVPGTRNRLSFVLVGVSDGLTPAEVANDNPFIAKYRLFEAGHWPLCVRGQAFYIF